MSEGDTGGRFEVTVGAEEAGARLDRFLAGRLAQLSRSRLQALIRAGDVTRDGAAVGDLGLRVRSGETYTVAVPAPEVTSGRQLQPNQGHLGLHHVPNSVLQVRPVRPAPAA